MTAYTLLLKEQSDMCRPGYLGERENLTVIVCEGVQFKETKVDYRVYSA